jgi:hypothetical protein
MLLKVIRQEMGVVVLGKHCLRVVKIKVYNVLELNFRRDVTLPVLLIRPW